MSDHDNQEELSPLLPASDAEDRPGVRAPYGPPAVRDGASSMIAAEPGAVGSEQQALDELEKDTDRRLRAEQWARRRRRRIRFSLALFVLTFVSTTLVGARYWPLDIMSGFFNEDVRAELTEYLDREWPTDEPMSIYDRFWQSCRLGCTYSVPLMLILLCHEMGHYLQARRYHVPASLPYFIPLPLPPLGTMGAVILQQRGVADRKQMFDIAVSGPLAGLVVTIPILIYGIHSSGYIPAMQSEEYELGQPLLVRWIIHAFHGPQPPGMTFYWNGFAMAGWVGVFITAMNLLPVGQLDGGHLLYTLVGRLAHWVAWGLILTSVVLMIAYRMYSYVLLLILLTLTGPRHPPTADDSVPIGTARHLLGWLTLGFLLIGFTMRPIVIPEKRPATQTIEAIDLEEAEETLIDMFSEFEENFRQSAQRAQDQSSKPDDDVALRPDGQAD